MTDCNGKPIGVGDVVCAIDEKKRKYMVQAVFKDGMVQVGFKLRGIRFITWQEAKKLRLVRRKENDNG